MILQDPMASLNPLFSIYRQVAEPAYYHRALRGRSLRERVRELLQRGAHPLAGDAHARISRTRCRAACASASSARSRWPAAPS